jgi:tetratricopeptide (TPR) repeat protein
MIHFSLCLCVMLAWRFTAYGEVLMQALKSLALGMLITGGWIVAACADDESDCRDGKDVELKIKGCSALIRADAKDAIAFYSRGAAYQTKGDLDKALADYSQAIVLKPDYAAAYENRARAFVDKGDYTRAVADVTKAGELKSKIAVQSKAVPSATEPAKTFAKPRPKATSSMIIKKSSPAESADEWPDWAPK